MAGLRDHRESAGGAGGPGLPHLAWLRGEDTFAMPKGKTFPFLSLQKVQFGDVCLWSINVVVGVQTFEARLDEAHEEIIANNGRRSKTAADRQRITVFLNRD